MKQNIENIFNDDLFTGGDIIPEND